MCDELNQNSMKSNETQDYFVPSVEKRRISIRAKAVYALGAAFVTPTILPLVEELNITNLTFYPYGPPFDTYSSIGFIFGLLCLGGANVLARRDQKKNH